MLELRLARTFYQVAPVCSAYLALSNKMRHWSGEQWFSLPVGYIPVFALALPNVDTCNPTTSQDHHST